MRPQRRMALVATFLLCAGIALVGLTMLLAVGPAAPRPVAVIRWETATEVNTAGFNLYRSERPDGPFTQQVNVELIPASTSPLTGGTYVYTDTAVMPGRTYFYELEEVENDGTRTRVGRISVRASGSPTLMRVVGGVLVVEAMIIGLFAWHRLRACEEEGEGRGE